MNMCIYVYIYIYIYIYMYIFVWAVLTSDLTKQKFYFHNQKSQ